MRTLLRAIAIAALAACGALPTLSGAAHAGSFSFTFANHLTDETVRGEIFHYSQGAQEGGVAAGGDTVISKSYEMQTGDNSLIAYFRDRSGSSEYCRYYITVNYTPSNLGWLSTKGTYVCSILPHSASPNKCPHASFPNEEGCNLSFMIER